MINKKSGRLPDHYMFHVQERPGGKGRWIEIAAGWNNQSGGINWTWQLQPNGKTVSLTREQVDANRKQVSDEPKTA